MTDNEQTPITLREEKEILAQTASIVAAFASQTHLTEDALASAIRRVHTELKSLNVPEQAPAAPAQELVPAVPIKKSITSEYLVCLEDGARLKMLKRYLRTRYNMTPADYRAKWGLPRDYPMVAPAYAQRRSDLAKEIGLGRTAATARKKTSTPAPAAPVAEAAPARGRGRKRAS